MEGYFEEQIEYLNEQRILIRMKIDELETKSEALSSAIEALRIASNVVEDGKGLHDEG